MGFTLPSSVEDYLALRETTYFLLQNNPSIVLTLVLGIIVAVISSVCRPVPHHTIQRTNKTNT